MMRKRLVETNKMISDLSYRDKEYIARGLSAIMGIKVANNEAVIIDILEEITENYEGNNCWVSLMNYVASRQK